MLLLFQKIHQELEQKEKEELQRGGTRERRPERNGVMDRERHRGSTKQKTEDEYELGRGPPIDSVLQLPKRSDPQSMQDECWAFTQTDTRWRHQLNIAWLLEESAWGRGRMEASSDSSRRGVQKATRLSKSSRVRISLVVRSLKLSAPNAEDTGSIPGQGTKISHAQTIKM